ncbi:hypothetical protein TREMEDRAFT_26073 [Tremella mesenterica DSM 1558]|uniref:uncharacterized protein n=1 Tax=Tremella mesenterica (strain ATCC 24925 / CBS 8224 / DSM 1558 / NBRC 9311 / NRRL Y-6157 / RJB 2259-6 / UBC 559-6) TaxID=578456 RepID=UPI0003F4A51A|nr:uncharacterized protein TREMEDRAFT_26073 [Tremella mesenterica DSM 1558]EIW71984.1 hypothetical protein TREMEDRAFT_26073 [Tremella mesenterica DSM 1558]
MHPPDPVNLVFIPPLIDSYTYHSILPPDIEGEWIMGIDEAGRGHIGPMVYAAALCPIKFKSTLEEMGFDDSKALSPETRQNLWDKFEDHPELCYSSATLSPQAISANMLRRIPVNLNRQAEDATVGLVQAALDRGIKVTECYVDALGPAPQWQARLSSLFPTISFTVCPKADSLFKIVSAASIIAKVTRDRYIENWLDWETSKSHESLSFNQNGFSWGSGYPSDPRTQAFLKENLDPVFGYTGAVRFSWATVKVLLDKNAVPCKWYVFFFHS